MRCLLRLRLQLCINLRKPKGSYLSPHCRSFQICLCKKIQLGGWHAQRNSCPGKIASYFLSFLLQTIFMPV